MKPSDSASSDQPPFVSLNSLRAVGWVALGVAALTLWLLPIPSTAKVTVLVIGAFAGVFTLLESTNRGKALAATMAALLVFYLALSLQRAWILMTSDALASRVMGAALVLIPVVGVWALVRELIFGIRIEQLGRQLAAEGGLPEDTLPRLPSGRIVREAADADFPRWQTDVEAAPDQWRTWYRLSLAYSASGDSKRARAAMRQAVRLSRDQSGPGQRSTGRAS
ncbi:MAG: tetratricopeptide repeat protein [Kocuria sp.]|nr:tetratricopeptide repeat protein [Kocuria sp.]